MSAAIDWKKPIMIAATDWQDELPARLVMKHGDDFIVGIEAPHQIISGDSAVWESGEVWYFDRDGKMIGSVFALRVINNGDAK